MESKNKTWLWAVAVLVAATLAGWMWWSSQQAATPEVSETAGPALTVEDTTSVIEAELNATDLGDVEKELKSTETDVNSL